MDRPKKQDGKSGFAFRGWRTFLVGVLALGVVSSFTVGGPWGASRAGLPVNVDLSLPTHVGSLLGAGCDHRCPFTYYLNDSTAALADYFVTLGYTLRRVREGDTTVPPVFVSALPSDLDAVEPVDRRKALFIRIMLPLVLRENRQLRADRQRLLKLRHKLAGAAALDRTDRAWLAEEYDWYGVDPGQIDRLLRRVDVIPTSLAMAQAITESGWGTSRFAQEGNALFGQWTWSKDDPGLDPIRRDENKTHRVRAFETLGEAVQAYMHTLNTHWAYRDFRLHRSNLRKAGKRLDGLRLAAGLRNYSTDRDLYVGSLRSVIRANDLTQLDKARLSEDGVVVRNGRLGGAGSPG